jgi:hypothetical protein
MSHLELAAKTLDNLAFVLDDQKLLGYQLQMAELEIAREQASALDILARAIDRKSFR